MPAVSVGTLDWPSELLPQHGQRNVPALLPACTQVDDVVGVRDIAGGGAHAIALLADGRVRSWGRCSEGQCQPPPALRCVRSIAGASYLTLSISAAQCCLADLNDDGVVQGADLGLMLAGWGPCVP